MGVSSDDGFRVTEGLGVSRQVLHVTGSGIDTDVEAVVTTAVNGAYGAVLPLTPVSGPAVFVPVPCPNLPGVVNLTNKSASPITPVAPMASTSTIWCTTSRPTGRWRPSSSTIRLTACRSSVTAAAPR